MYTVVKLGLLLCTAFAVSSFNLGVDDVRFQLYTVNNPQSSETLLPTVPSIMISSFSLSRRTVVTIHNNVEGVAGNFNAFVVPAHLSVENANVIAVQWNSGALEYSLGLAHAPQVGERIAEFINILITSFGYSANMVRIVGVGLGAHIAGIAARNVQGNIPHIIALDPSLHGWTHHPDKLSTDAADFVEVLHTTAGALGYDFPLGHLDFYANGGTYQTGCSTDISCSHIYAYVFYAESVTREVNGGNSFIGTACDGYDQAVVLQCTGSRDATFGGSNVKTGPTGVYIFLTNFSPPFATN